MICAPPSFLILRNAYQSSPDSPPQRASIEESFLRLKGEGVSGDALWDAVRDQQVELVFTAHPTQAQRRTLLQKHRTIAELLERRDRGGATVRERHRLAATRPVQGQPTSAPFEPIGSEATLPLVRKRTRDVAHEEVAVRKPLVEVGEVARNTRGRQV